MAVDRVSLEVKRGELFGLIGPDGAGKTSIFRMLTTLLLPSSGSASVDGFDVVKDYKTIRGRVGYMPGRFSLYQDLSVEENLAFFANLFNTSIEENYNLIEGIYVQLEPFKTRKAGKLSGGMKQKLALCCALIHQPSVLFLDEPTTGVDAVSRKEFWDMLKKLKEQGITIMVSTPYMDEANRCDRIALMQSGQVLSVDTPVAGKAEMHEHIDQNGLMKMQQVQFVTIPAGGEATFAPMAYHVMLFNLKQQAREGERFPLTLHFEKAGEVTVQVAVQKDAPAEQHDMSQHKN